MKTMTCKFKWKNCFTMTMVVFMAAALMLPGSAMAADNIGTGDIGGDSASLNASNTFQLFTTTMSLNKTAFLANGTKLASGVTLPRGTEVRFVIYINNTTTFPLTDVSIQDILDSTFAYQAGSLKADNTLASTGSETLIYNTVNAVATTLSDAINADIASAVGITVEAGTTGGNGQVDVPASTVWSILFRTLMQ
jgi:uncharacterized repeat protein (TIGR01451 family)